MIKPIKFNSVEEREAYMRVEIAPVIGELCTDMLIHKGFCSAPASTHYHGAYAGGLFDHSVAVTQMLCEYTQRLGLSWCKEDSPIRIGMLHDACKCDQYRKDIDGSFAYDNSAIVKGHGEKSVIYAVRYGCQLTEEEMACILYHMGAYEKDKWDAYENAIKRYPNVLYTHTADMAASKILGV